METVRINTRLKEFRSQAHYDKDGAAQKLWKCLNIFDFKENALFDTIENIPEIILMAVYLIYGHKILTFYLEQILKSRQVFKIEEWPK